MGKAGKCTEMKGSLSYSRAVTSCQGTTNSDVQMQTALPSARQCCPVIYFILTSVNRPCFFNFKKRSEWALPPLEIFGVCIQVLLYFWGHVEGICEISPQPTCEDILVVLIRRKTNKSSPYCFSWNLMLYVILRGGGRVRVWKRSLA